MNTTTHTLRCRVSTDDYAEAYIDAEGDVRLEVKCGHTSAHLYARPEDFAAFARKVLTGTGESVDDSPVKVGDYVEITSTRAYSREFDGLKGRLTQIDDDGVPYLVETEEEGEIWATEVRKVHIPDAGSSRLTYVEQARKALDGTYPTAADIVRLAELLATGD
jgi:hypothetical protein